VGQVRLVAALAPPLAPRQAAPVSVEALRPLRSLAWSGPADPTFEIVRRSLEEHGLSREPSVEIPHIETLRELVAAAAGYTILPDYAVRRDAQAGRLLTLPLEGLSEEVPVWLVGRPGQVVGPALAAVRDRLRTGLGGALGNASTRQGRDRGV
jgi:DNA-binding transcriptional LysR family regulator